LSPRKLIRVYFLARISSPILKPVEKKPFLLSSGLPGDSVSLSIFSATWQTPPRFSMSSIPSGAMTHTLVDLISAMFRGHARHVYNTLTCFSCDRDLLNKPRNELTYVDPPLSLFFMFLPFNSSGTTRIPPPNPLEVVPDSAPPIHVPSSPHHHVVAIDASPRHRLWSIYVCALLY
jgi:hypothetical protein